MAMGRMVKLENAPDALGVRSWAPFPRATPFRVSIKGLNQGVVSGFVIPVQAVDWVEASPPGRLRAREVGAQCGTSSKAVAGLS